MSTTTFATASRKSLDATIKSFAISGEARHLLLEGWAVMGAVWGCETAWLVLPDGSSRVLARDKFCVGKAELLLSTDAPVCTVIMTGQVCGKYESREEKLALIAATARQWKASAFKGWADRPGEERDERLTVANKLAAIAGVTL